MFDVWSNAPWEATDGEGHILQYPLIYRVVSPADDMSKDTANVTWQPTTIEFPDLARITRFALEGQLAPGQTVNLHLLWDATTKTSVDWSEFIHLVGPTISLPLGDSSPRGNLYPTWAWTPGERIVETWALTLPADLPTGNYSLQIGFSDRSTGQRIAAIQNGRLIPSGSAELQVLTIK